MVMKAEPFLRAVEALLPDGPAAPARGRAALAARTALRPGDRRRASPASTGSCCSAAATRGSTSGCAEALGAEEVSLGDFVLTGGEVAALAVIEATVRLLPGALGDEGSAEADSFADGLLDFPHYTRPAEVRGLARARGAALGRPRADPPLAAQGGAARDARAAAGPAGAARPSTAEDRALLREIERRGDADGGLSADAQARLTRRKKEHESDRQRRGGGPQEGPAPPHPGRHRARARAGQGDRGQGESIKGKPQGDRARARAGLRGHRHRPARAPAPAPP